MRRLPATSSELVAARLRFDDAVSGEYRARAATLSMRSPCAQRYIALSIGEPRDARSPRRDAALEDEISR
jgi:hypothetical protein